jgi:hypothetical protein
MKTLMLAAAAMILAVAVNSASALAEAPRASSGNAMSQTAATMNSHYQWQYHYGNKARFEGHWVLAR